MLSPFFIYVYFLVLLDAHHALFQSEALQLQLNLSEEIRNSQELRLQAAQHMLDVRAYLCLTRC